MLNCFHYLNLILKHIFVLVTAILIPNNFDSDHTTFLLDPHSLVNITKTPRAKRNPIVNDEVLRDPYSLLHASIIYYY